MLSRDHLINLGTAAILLAVTGCKKESETKSITPPLNVNRAPRYIPTEQLPIRQERPFFIEYAGTNPPLEHLQYLEKICGRLSISLQDPVIIIGTDAENCEAKIRAQKP